MKRPSRTSPGLHIVAPSADERAPGYAPSPSLLELTGNVPTELADQPSASYACHCGQTGEATGRRAVQALITAYNDHDRTCPDDNGKPWERHGQPRPPRAREGR
ncbi:hypothetical protein ACH4PU_17995 [Streptomyces sp. NPDC021100]|uniref:hypothetical protein n=1 Tax=Streptomyces sp. NPDC021100 TaxID=3365114 RepID=UPI0037AB27BA